MLARKRVGLSSLRGGYGAFTSTVPCKLGTGCNPHGWQGISAEFYSTVPAKPEMEYRNLGASGLKVSALSIGSWVTFGNQIDEPTSYEICKTAYDLGINFFDNAEIYAHGEAERVMGKILKKAGWRRESIVVSTKIFWGEQANQKILPNDRGLSRKHIIEGTHAALKRLQLDYVDLVFCHRPDIETPIEETVRAMNYLIDKGLCFYWGTSEWSATQILEAYHIARRERLIPPTMEQPEYSMLTRDKVEKEFASLYNSIGLGLTTWSPLKYGVLTGKYNEGVPKDSRGGSNEAGKRRILSLIGGADGEKTLQTVEKLKTVAQSLDCTLAQLALAWCLKNKNVSTVITGASKSSQLIDNIAALDVKKKLTDDVMTHIDEILHNKPDPEKNFRSN